ncbi:unnamed protein product [Brassica rapa subsp. trilocularis]
MKQGESSVREYNTRFLAGGLVDKHDEPTLVKMYREGLRKNIRSEIGTTVFKQIQIHIGDIGFSTPGSVSTASGTVTNESESLTATNSTADGDSLADSIVSFANIVVENSAAGGGSVTDSSVSVVDNVANNSAAGLGSISGSNSTRVGSVSGSVADSSPSAAGSSRSSNSVAFSGAGK